MNKFIPLLLAGTIAGELVHYPPTSDEHIHTDEPQEAPNRPTVTTISASHTVYAAHAAPYDL